MRERDARWSLAAGVLVLSALLGVQAVDADAKEGARQSVERAIADLAAPEPAKRAAAARTLRGTFPEGACAVPLLEVALRDEEAAVRRAAEEAIVALANEGAKALVAFLEDTSHPQNRAFCDARDRILKEGMRITPWMLDKIEGRDARAVRFCLDPAELDPGIERRKRLLLRELLASDAGTFDRAEHVLASLADRRIACAALAVSGLASLPTRSTSSLPKGALELASHEDDRLRWAGGRLLEVLRGDSQPRAKTETPSVKELIAQLPDPAGYVQGFDVFFASKPIRALAEMGPSARAAVPRLEALVKRLEAPDVRVEGEQFLLVGALCRIAGPSQARVATLLAGLDGAEDPAPGRARRASWAAKGLALGAGGISDAVLQKRIAEHAAKAMASPDVDLRETLLDALEALGPAAAPAALAVAKTLPWTEERLAEHEGMAREKAGDPKAHVTRLDAFLASGAKLWDYAGVVAVRHRAARWLAAVGSLPRSVRPVLEPLAKADDPLLRCEVAACLRRAEK